MGRRSKLRASLAAALRATRRRLGLAEAPVGPRTLLTIDRLSVRGRLLHGWGWALHPRRRIAALTLVREIAGGQHELAAEWGFPRPDVQAHFPEAPHAAASGFVVYGVTEAPIAPGDRLRFVVDFADGGREELVARAAPTFLDGPVEAKSVALARARRQGRAAKARLRGLVPRLAVRDELAALAPALAGAAPIVLTIDHDLGGGANVFRRKLIEARVREGARVVLVRWSIASLSWAVDVHAAGAVTTVRFFDERTLQRWLDGLGVTEVALNDVVSFPRPLPLLAWLARLVARTSAALTVFVHDFEAVCPGWTLLDHRGDFCGVPDDRATCEACFRATRVPFKSVLEARSIADWRASWGELLALAREIRCFSESSKALLLRAHPALAAAPITVVPHTLEHVENRPVRHDVRAPIRIGVVGEIAPHKGSEVVRALSEEVRRSGVDVRVVVVGTLATDESCEHVTVTGRYAPGELPELLERHGVNVCLFPSIWPETFSYVCEELMQMGLPVVAFDLGAPAERLRRYPRGCVVPRGDAPDLLARITAFIEELRGRKAEGRAP